MTVPTAFLPDPSPLPPEMPPIEPPKRWYWFGSIAIAVGLIVGAVWAINGLVVAVRQVDHFARVVMPGKAELAFARAGSYTIYYEYSSAVDGVRYETSHTVPDGLKVVVSDADTNNAITTLELYTGDVTVDSNGRRGKAVFTFTLDKPGNYFIEATTADPAQPKFVLSIGRGFVRKVLVALGIGALFAFGGLAIGLPMIIVTGVRRGKEKRRRGAPPAMGGWPAYDGFQGHMGSGPVYPTTPGGGWGPPTGPPVG